MPSKHWTLTEEEVDFLIRWVIESARSSGLAVTVAVVDAGGHPLGLLRMDGARVPSANVASLKAWTSAMFQRPSRAYQTTTAPGADACTSLWNAFPGKMLPVPGGYPILVDGDCLGAVGVSGGSSDEDEQLAAEAVKTLLGPRRLREAR